MPKRPYPTWQRRHDAILLYVLEHPGAKQKDIAAATGYTPSHVSRILASPDFVTVYAGLRRKVATQAILKFLSGSRADAPDPP
jgi:hypothetical protein